MGTIYAVVNQKGGVGKTTTAVNVSAYLALAGARTLLVDADPQANATSGLGIDRQTLAELDLQRSDRQRAGPRGDGRDARAGPALLPATMDLAGADIELMPRISRETYLAPRAGAGPRRTSISS